MAAHFDCSGVDAVEPIIDRLELSLRFNTGLEHLSRTDPEYARQVMERYEALCHMIARDAGRLQKLKKKRYCPQFGITLTEPGLHWGWGKIYLEPTTEALEALQRWLYEYFGPDKIRANVKLRLVELAFDFFIPGFNQDAYNALALRLASRIVPRHSVNAFSRAMLRSDRKKRSRDFAQNGRLTCYCQSATRKDRHRSGWNLSRNKKSGRHTKIYAKALGRGRNKQWFLRIEMTLQGKRVRQLMDDFASLMNITNGMRFSDFWMFRQVDVEKFLASFPQPEPGLRGIRNRATRWMLTEVAVQSSADKLRMLKDTAARYNLPGSRVGRCVKEITFQKALNMPRPADFEIPESPLFKAAEEELGLRLTKPLPRDSVPKGKFRLQGFWNIQQSQPKLLGI